MKRSTTVYLVLFLLLGVPVIWVLLNKMGDHQVARLPIYGERYVDEKGDTVYHTVPPFSFVNQDGQTVTARDYAGHIYVASMFFTTCKDICPKLNQNLSLVFNNFKDVNEVRFLSHTVDPDNDSIPVLKAYSQKLGVQAPKWNFVRGTKDQLFRAGMGYLLAVSIADSTIDHSSKVVLVDPDMRIRGYFDGTNYADMQQLSDAIKALRVEYTRPEDSH